MSAVFDPLSSDKSRLDRLALVVSWFCVLLPLLGLLAPKAVVPLVSVAAICAASILGSRAFPWKVVDPATSLALILAIVWCLAASFWSYQPVDSAILALRIGVLLFLLHYLCVVSGHFDRGQRRTVALGLTFGMGLTAVLVIVEFSAGFPIFTVLKGPAGNDYQAFSQLNRGVSTLAILTWPLAAYLWLNGLRLLTLAVLPAMLALSLASQSSATVLGLGAGMAVAAVACLGRTAGRLVLAIAVVGALVGSPGIAKLMKQSELEQAEFLPNSARYRVHIWDFVADRILERPVAGWGFDSAAYIPTGGTEPFADGRKVIPSHPHNGPLQILVELGAVGGLLAIGLLFLVARGIEALPTAGRICSTAMFVTVLAIACTAYGMWQSHWLTVIGSAAAIMIAAAPRPVRKPLGSIDLEEDRNLPSGAHPQRRAPHPRAENNR